MWNMGTRKDMWEDGLCSEKRRQSCLASWRSSSAPAALVLSLILLLTGGGCGRNRPNYVSGRGLSYYRAGRLTLCVVDSYSASGSSRDSKQIPRQREVTVAGLRVFSVFPQSKEMPDTEPRRLMNVKFYNPDGSISRVSVEYRAGDQFWVDTDGTLTKPSQPLPPETYDRFFRLPVYSDEIKKRFESCANWEEFSAIMTDLACVGQINQALSHDREGERMR